MASASATALPSLVGRGGKTHLRKSTAQVAITHFGTLRNLSVPAAAAGCRVVPVLAGKQRYHIIAKAVGDGSDSSGNIVKFVKDAWNESEDRIALVGLGFAGIVALWASINIVGAIDKLPLIPSVFEFIGILYSWWFVYRYLLFKPDRAELVEKVKKSFSNVLGE